MNCLTRNRDPAASLPSIRSARRLGAAGPPRRLEGPLPETVILYPGAGPSPEGDLAGVTSVAAGQAPHKTIAYYKKHLTCNINNSVQCIMQGHCQVMCINNELRLLFVTESIMITRILLLLLIM